MKRIQIIYIAIFSFFVGTIFFSCSEENESVTNKGKGKIIINLNTDTSVLTRSEEIDVDQIVLKIQRIDEENQPITQYPLASTGTYEYEFDAGTYQLTAIVGKDPEGAPTTSPYYIGGVEVTLSSEVPAIAEITCKLTTSLIQVDYTGLGTAYNNFEYKTEVTTEGYSPITFYKGDGKTVNDDGEDVDGKLGYFVPAPLSVVFCYNNDGWIEIPMDSIAELKPQYKYTIEYSVKEPDGGITEGSAGIGITINEDSEKEEGTITIELPKFKQELLEVELDDIGETSATVYARASINNGGEFNIIFEYKENSASEWLSISPTPQSEDLYSAELTNLQPGKSYDVRIRDDNSIERTFETKSINIQVNPWAKFALLSSSFSRKFDISDLDFKYKRASSSDNWTTIRITPDSDKNYQSVIKDIEENVQYEYQWVSNHADIESEIATFTADGTPTIANLNFDDWYSVRGGNMLTGYYYTYYPGVSNSNIFWDSGNKGANTVSGVSPTLPEETFIKLGKAAKLESKTATLGIFAAGNIYTGKFINAVLTPPGAQLDFGIDYTGRPTKLRGHYAYQPVAINKTGGNYSDWSGKQDTCSIYIALFDENWNGPFRVNTATSTFVDFTVDNCIAYGAISDEEAGRNNMEEYAEFEIDIQYRHLDRKPKWVLIVASASKYGDYFTGGVGSTLYIDEFELGFDYNEASF